ncbi:MAG: hypothetical protein J4415_01970 [Candidatus Diapherotrites archaeon]|uniref:Uncharacterized protein n=1 Tax=Candidatus Iainarchaeum sp. TaxID=3101447 RepID=A0A8T4KV18_9ARCH|nr:hypothetical protein [Candidatus Diapherotrites archaeon]
MNIVALKVFAAVAAIFLGSAAITLVIVNPNVNAFAALIFGNGVGAQGNGNSLEAGLAANGNSADDKNAGSGAGANGISSSLSYEVMGFTRLDANLLAEQEIPECPNSADLTVRIRNSGKYAAEKISIGANSGRGKGNKNEIVQILWAGAGDCNFGSKCKPYRIKNK